MSRDSIVLTDSLLQAYIDDDVEVKAGQSAEEERARGAGPTIRPGFDAILHGARASRHVVFRCAWNRLAILPLHPSLSPALNPATLRPFSQHRPSSLPASLVIPPLLSLHWER